MLRVGELRAFHGPRTQGAKPVKELAIVVGLLALWFLLQTVILPKFGVST